MFEQIKLDYATDALEPWIDQITIETHHGKHHATYTKNFNDLVEKAGLTGKSAEEILAHLDTVDASLRQGLKNQGGGYYNHNLYFEMFSPNPAKAPTGKLADAINKKFGSLETCKEEITKLAAAQFGSGWAWLSTDKSGVLAVSKTDNQDNPISEGTGMIPLVALDVWEHAYYLKYKNLRPDYINAFWEVLDWGKVSARYEEIIK
ncbi:superoxide dismutase, Fe-Mn family [Pseudobutyrivibrio sp. ACV-2]|uniref:superoxide dismutase n=1 Tax=Pseudobutyrivibrio sp. ACV-2 TaxID=1520801 RepID=UPI000894C68A|nr:superoxide dismutase [Pseudobutyrivibrio sp. ACV-2]SEA78097.1 superoxide dismutase, Fe-Mn family [Pseudobutyrivibrio sp. ACV-2]